MTWGHLHYFSKIYCYQFVSCPTQINLVLSDFLGNYYFINKTGKLKYSTVMLNFDSSTPFVMAIPFYFLYKFLVNFPI